MQFCIGAGGTVVQLLSRLGGNHTVPVECRATSRALILGGFGMQPDHCRELEKLYRENQIATVTPICHSLPGMTVFRIGDRRARELAQWFNTHCAEDHSVIHLFSGAVFVFGLFLSYLTEQARNAIHGVVFECSPMDCQAEQFGRFLSWRLGRQYSRRYALPFSVLRPLMGINRRFEVAHQRALLLLPTHTKFHFIQSDNDPIIDAAYVEAYGRSLEGRGHTVSMTSHADARHCRALSDRADDYRADLQAFLHQARRLAGHDDAGIANNLAGLATT